MSDEIERIRALLAEAGRCGCDAPSAHGLRTAHIATLLAALDAKSAEVERLRGERDQARRAAIEEAIREAESWEPIVPVNVRDSHPEMVRYYGMLSQRRTIIDGLRALLDGPAVRPATGPDAGGRMSETSYAELERLRGA